MTNHALLKSHSTGASSAVLQASGPMPPTLAPERTGGLLASGPRKWSECFKKVLERFSGCMFNGKHKRISKLLVLRAGTLQGKGRRRQRITYAGLVTDSA